MLKKNYYFHTNREVFEFCIMRITPKLHLTSKTLSKYLFQKN